MDMDADSYHPETWLTILTINKRAETSDLICWHPAHMDVNTKFGNCNFGGRGSQPQKHFLGLLETIKRIILTWVVQVKRWVDLPEVLALGNWDSCLVTCWSDPSLLCNKDVGFFFFAEFWESAGGYNGGFTYRLI